jgi:hypothetical protein
MQPNDDFLDQWENIIADINKTDIPLECIKKIIVKLEGGRQKTINLQTLKKQGLDLDEIESVLTRYLSENDTIIRDVDFMVDIAAVANLVQPETDKLLGKL